MKTALPNMLHACAAALLSIGCTIASPAIAAATTATYTITNVPSVGTFGDPGNFVATIQLSPLAEIVGLSWDVNLIASSPSLLAEMTVVLSDSAETAGVQVAPGYTSYSAGTGHFADTYDLAANGESFSVGADGLLRLEFAEAYDDLTVSPDGTWLSGTLTFTLASAVPEPASYGMMALGLLAVGAAARRRVH